MFTESDVEVSAPGVGAGPAHPEHLAHAALHQVGVLAAQVLLPGLQTGLVAQVAVCHTGPADAVAAPDHRFILQNLVVSGLDLRPDCLLLYAGRLALVECVQDDPLEVFALLGGGLVIVAVLVENPAQLLCGLTLPAHAPPV